MRGLLIGIAGVALVLVLLGGIVMTTGAGAPGNEDARLRHIPDRFVEIQMQEGQGAAAPEDSKSARGPMPATRSLKPQSAPATVAIGSPKNDKLYAPRQSPDEANQPFAAGAANPFAGRGEHAPPGSKGKRAAGEAGRFGRVSGLAKTGTAVTGDDGLVIGHGSGGMGLRGTGKGGGGEGFGRIHGMEKVAVADTRRSRKKKPKLKKIMLEELAIEGREDAETVAVEEEAAKAVRPTVSADLKPKPAPVRLAAPEPPPPPSADFDADLSGKKAQKARLKRERKRAVEKKTMLFSLKRDADKAVTIVDALDEVCDGANEDCDGDVERRPLVLPDRLDLSALASTTETQSRLAEQPPERFLPRMCYFENTYLGGNAAYQEQLQRVRAGLGDLRPLEHARLDPQAFDPPADAGMALSASLSHTGLQQPGRVVLQVGLQGSQRYGWRRPPLDVVLVVDGPARSKTKAAADALLAQLSPRDRLGIIRAGDAAPVAPVASVRAVRDALIDLPPAAGGVDPHQLARAMRAAGAMLNKAAGDAARVPGSQTVIVLTQSHGQASSAPAARSAAHALQVQGAVVSVIQLGFENSGAWWAVANAGHGNFHRTRDGEVAKGIEAELASLSKVVARLLRVNVRLGPQAEAVRVIGSRVLGQQEVKAVKAREVATDRNLSKTMGVKADRGDDDDGIQTVIPYFYGDDSHVILVELWVDPSKARPDTAIAEVSLKYKDMVNLDNATARAAVYLGRRPEPATPEQRIVKRNLAGFAFAAALNEAADHAARSDWPAARRTLRNHAATRRDREVLQAFEPLFGQRSPADLERALRLASRQRKGATAMEAIR